MTSGNFPNDWEETRLGDLLKRVRKPVALEPASLYKEIGIRSHGKGIFHKEERSGESIGEKSVFWVEPDCFIVNIVFAWEQAIAKTTVKEKGMIASHRFPMYKPIEGKLNLDYLVYFFKAPRGKYLLGSASPGGAGRNKTLGQKEFLNLPMPLPPYNEQCKIVEILSTWDQSIALTDELIAAKQQMKKELQLLLIEGELRFSGFVEEPKKTNLAAVIEFARNGYSSKQNKTTNGYPVSRIETISNGTVDFNSIGYADVPLERLANYELLKGDILFSHINSLKHIGKVAIYDSDQQLFHGMNLLAIRVDSKKILPEFAFYLLSSQSAKSYFRLRAKPAINQASLNRNDLLNFKFLLPTLGEQQSIKNFLRTSDDEIDLLIKKQDNLKQQRKGLMQKLLTGQIRVKV
jgi:type I restriction enzyme, S subunit